MKNILKWIGLVVGGLLGIIIIASVLLYFFLPLNAIKDYATKQLSDQLHHEVQVKGVSFNIFSGIRLTGLTVANRKGFDDAPLISADAVELKYLFWPLFSGKVIIPEINLVKPQILIEKSRKGDFNFSDMLASKSETRTTKADKRSQIDLIINTFSITKGKLTYYDYSTASRSKLRDVNLTVSGITLALIKPIDLKFAAVGSYQDKEVALSLSANLLIDPAGDYFKVPRFALGIAGQTLQGSVDLANLKKGPALEASLRGERLAIDPFIAFFAGGAPAKEEKKKPVHGALTQSLKAAFSSLPANLSGSLNLDLNNITLSRLKIDTLKTSISLKNRQLGLDIKTLSAYNGKLLVKGLFNLPALSYNLGQVELKGFDAAPFANDAIDSYFPDMLDAKNKIEGKLDAYLAVKGAGAEMPEVFANLAGSGTLLLSDGRLKKLKSLESIGEKYNVNLLKHDLLVHGLRVDFSLANRLLDVKRLNLQDTDLQAAFTGGLDFNKMEYRPGNRLNLKFSPAATGTLPKELSIFKDAQGFTSVDFELLGSLTKPKPSPRFEKAIEVGVGKIKAKIEAEKIEIETKAKEEVDKSKKQLEEEAKKKVKEILKF
ncbi:AsmA family protein [Candidatus Saganbacteria bacterium]|nr:AsmA family protein [Candidatus Saganbacteria bacterium]